MAQRPQTSRLGDQEPRGSGAHARAWISESAPGVECAKLDAGQWNRRPSDSVNTQPLECEVFNRLDRLIDPLLEQVMDIKRAETWPAERASGSVEASQPATASASTPLASATLARPRAARLTSRRARTEPVAQLWSMQPLSASWSLCFSTAVAAPPGT